MPASKRPLSVALATLAALPLVASTALAAPCDSSYVQASHKHITVLPTGGDDTANLQCAFDYGATLGPGVTIQLTAGTFHTAQLVVYGVHESIRGMGQQQTIIRTLDTPLRIDRPDCTGAGPCFADDLPAADNRYPNLISLIGTDVVMSDLWVDIHGLYLTEPWTIWGFWLEGFSHVLLLVGSGSSAEFTRVTVTGDPFGPDANGAWVGTGGGILMWTFYRWRLANSSLTVTDSVIGAEGVRAFSFDSSRLRVLRNRFLVRPGSAALVVADARDSDVTFSHNEVVGLEAGTIGFLAGLGVNGEKHDTRLFIANNRFSGDAGITFQSGSFDDVSCFAVKNDMSQVTNPYVWDSTTPCRVVGRWPRP